MSSREWLRGVGLGALVLGAQAAMAQGLKADAAQLRQLGVTTVEVRSATQAGVARYPAQIQIPLAQQRVISAPVPGGVDALWVVQGQMVRLGMPLVRLRSQQVAEWQRDWQQLKAQLDLMQRTMARDEQLYSEGLIALSRLEASRAQVQQQRVLVEERGQSLTAAGAKPEGIGGELVLTAPMAGQVLEVTVTPGQRVDAVTPLIRLASSGSLWAELSVPVSQAAQLRLGDKVRGIGVAVEGTITSFAPAVQGGSQTTVVRADLRGAGLRQLRAGQAIELEVQRHEAGVVQVPAGAVLEDARGAAVYVQRKAGQFERRPVRVMGRSGADGSVSVSGLTSGDHVAATGTAALKAIEGDGAAAVPTPTAASAVKS
ncbi:MAG: efflux RND transporter periplasmic adaptor subunit [Leptothrix ochracea]|uniref:efflux RND transporter periplasmic adaptor subunit n=1 Tax=Leptothrix ochracea TaxID=735331 RepID=UPI0034E25B5B